MACALRSRVSCLLSNTSLACHRKAWAATRGDPGPSTVFQRRLSISTALRYPRQRRFGLWSRSVQEIDVPPGQLEAEVDRMELRREEDDFFVPDMGSPEAMEVVEEVERRGDGKDFQSVVSDLRRRKRKDEAKRLQRGSAFIDHLIVQIRGGQGGAGSAAFTRLATGASGPPVGGNGGHGGSVYVTTSPDLSSLVSLLNRYNGGRGSNGAGAVKHGRRGDDVTIHVPVGTVIRELGREGEEDLIRANEDSVGMSAEQIELARRERRFLRHPGSRGRLFSEEEEREKYRIAEKMLREAGRASVPTPTFERQPPVILDIDRELKEPVLLAKGGQGGLGNPFFSVGQIRDSALASRGLVPTTHTYQFELKILADVGLVGFPNAGKSTLLRGLTGRKAEVAGYEFTTLNPQIGVVRVFEDGSFGGTVNGMIEDTREEQARDEEARRRGEYQQMRSPDEKPVNDLPEINRFTVSDNPGLLPLAHQDVGLGHSFLRSIERCLVLAYVLDLSGASPEKQLLSLREELEAYKPGLADKASVVVLNKADEVDEATGRQRIGQVRQVLQGLEREYELVTLSGKYGLGLKGLVRALSSKVQDARAVKTAQLAAPDRMVH